MPVLIGLALVIGLLAGASLDGVVPGVEWHKNTKTEISAGAELDEIFRYIDFKYVDQLDLDSLGERTLKSLLRDLDPHSTYISPEELQEYNEQSEGRYRGIGVEFAIIDDTVRVVGLVDGDTPARSAGMKTGDRILTVDGRKVSGSDLPADTVTAILRGQMEDHMADLEILAFPENRLKQLSVKRSEITVKSVVSSYMLTDEIAYIRLDKFTLSSYREFMEALESLFTSNDNANDLVLDLRGNPGGYLDEAVKIASQFFKEKGRMIVFTEGENAEKKEYKTPGKVFFDIDKVVVLMDHNSASGSEVVAGAVQDWDRGLILGERSFGKGLVQEQYGLSNGGAVRLTTARYFTPAGRLIQKPYKLAKTEPANSTEDSLVRNDSNEFVTLVEKRSVFGGMGIQPDIFIPQAPVIPFHMISEVQNLIFEAYVDKYDMIGGAGNREDLEESLSNDPVNWLARFDNEMNSWFKKLIDQDKMSVLRQLDAELIRLLYGEKGKWRYLNDEDATIDQAINMLQSSEPFRFSSIK